jgi:hypothetical protein
MIESRCKLKFEFDFPLTEKWTGSDVAFVLSVQCEASLAEAWYQKAVHSVTLVPSGLSVVILKITS